MRNYREKELLDKVRSLPSYTGIPDDYWILGVQSKEDRFNEFDDMFYLFKGTKLITKTTGTTNAGLTGLQNYNKYTSKGCAVIKTNEWYQDLWKFGYHKGKMPSLKQINPILFYRDWNKNKKVEEYGTLYEDLIGINFHTVTYQGRVSLIQKLIGGWSVGCQVLNNVQEYYKILDLVKHQPSIDYCLIKEF